MTTRKVAEKMLEANPMLLDVDKVAALLEKLFDYNLAWYMHYGDTQSFKEYVKKKIFGESAFGKQKESFISAFKLATADDTEDKVVKTLDNMLGILQEK